MGAEFEALLVGPDPEYLRDAGYQALEEVAQLEARLSHYRTDSEISDLNLRAAYGPVRLEPTLFALLTRCVALSAATNGAFDTTAGPLIRCWGFFRGQGEWPTAETVSEAMVAVGSQQLRLDEAEHTVQFGVPGMQVHLGAIGKGYAVDRMVATLRELRVEAALVHGGGSTVYGLEAPPGEDAWEIGLRHPDDSERRLGVVHLRNRALSTSGDYEQFFQHEGRRYSHLLDPRTGYPAQGVRSATVLAESATDTDALSTAAFVLGEAGAAAVLEARPGVGLVLALESDEPKLAQSAGDKTPRESHLAVRTLGSATLHPAPPGVPNEGVTP
jgi:thiamine biosynthesis lipoprotein